MSGSWKGGSTTRWRRLRAAILKRDHYKCRINGPGCDDNATQVDHIVPLHAGGAKYDPTNLRAACQVCNLARKRTEPNHEPPPRRVSSW